MPFSSQKQRAFLHWAHPIIASRWEAEARRASAPAIQAADLDLEYRRQLADAYRQMTKPADKKYGDAPGTLDLGTFGDVPPPAPPPPPPAAPWQPEALTVEQLSAEQTGTPVRGAPAPVVPVPVGDDSGYAAIRSQPLAPPESLAPKRDPMLEPYAPEADAGGPTPTAPAMRAPPGDAAASRVDIRKPQTAAAPGSPQHQYDTALVGPARAVSVPAREVALMAPQRIAELQQDQDAIQGAQRDLGSAQAQAAQDEGDIAARRGDVLGEQQDQMAQRARERDDYLHAQEGKIKSLSDEVASAKLDPDAWWHKQGLGNVLRYHLAAAFQGFVAGMKGGPNLAIQQINKLVDDDLAKQRDAIERKKGAVGDMQGLLASAYRRFGNLDQAEAAARGVAMQQLDAEQQAYAARTGSAAAMAKSNLVSAQMKLDADRSLASLYRYAPAAVASAGGLTAAQQKALGELAADIRKGAATNGRDLTPEEARRQAAATLGYTTGSGYADISKGGAGAKQNATIQDQIAVGNQAIANIESLRESDGSLPGTNIISRNAPDAVRGTKARQMEGALTTLAEAVAHANGQRGTEAVMMNKRTIMGNGSQADLDAGIVRAKKTLAARSGGGAVDAGSEGDRIEVTPETED